MEKEKFLELLDRYISGKASLEEEQQLLNLYDSFKKSADLDKQPEMDQLGEKMLNRLMGGIRKEEPAANVPEQFHWKKLAVAAVFLVAAMSGLYFYSSSSPSESRQFTAVNIKNDIAPEYNNAVLRLADGSHISLKYAPNGLVASQGDIDIVKTDSDEIVYLLQPKGDGTRKEGFSENIIENPKGGKCKIVLPDGSKVWLNSASTLSFPIAFAPTERKVRLTGEAYFEITHNKKAPFRVESDKQTVEVLGTHFNINSYKDEAYTKTTLMEGSVRVILRSSKLKLPKVQLLKPGEQSLTDPEHSEITVQSADVEEANAWKNGYFKFKNTPMQEVMKEIARWYNVDLVYEGKIPGDEFTGYISNAVNISKVLKILGESSDLKFTIRDRTLKITSTP